MKARVTATDLTSTSQERPAGPSSRSVRRARALPGARTRGRCATADHAAPNAPSMGTISIISYI